LAYSDLREFIAKLEEEGELRRITADTGKLRPIEH